MRKVVIAFICMGCLMLCSGCGLVVARLTEFTKDVAPGDQLWGGFSHGTVYVLKIDVFLRTATNSYPNMILVPPRTEERLGSSYHNAPPSTDGWKDNWPKGYGLVKAGTRLRAENVVEHGAMNASSSLHVQMRILDGAREGMLVDISNLTKVIPDTKDPFLSTFDERILGKE